MALALATMVLSACASRAEGPSSQPIGDQRLSDQRPTQASRPLNIALYAEPSALGSKFSGGGTGIADYSFLFSAKLAHYDETGTPIAVLLAELPSLDRGTWKVFPDGTMEVRYQLRTGLTWQDGHPFSADDVRFTWATIMDPTMPANDREPEKFIGSMEIVDPHTIVTHWSETYIFANAWDLEPIAQRIFEPLAQRDPQSFANTSSWGLEWVGLGPYQIVDWVQGAYLRGRAFDRFALGSPKISDIIVQFVPDENQTTARVLAGTVDVTLGNALRVDEGMIIKEQLEPRGEATVMTIPTKIRYGELQYREPRPPPSRDVRVRQALLHATDKQILVDTLLRGLTVPADLYLTPNDAAFPTADRAIRKYPFDLIAPPRCCRRRVGPAVRTASCAARRASVSTWRCAPPTVRRTRRKRRC